MKPQGQPVPSPLVDYSKRQIRPWYDFRIMNKAPIIRYLGRIPAAPRIVVVEEYTTESFLGDYGAGQVVNTFSLLPGERTTISVRTYQDKTDTSSTSDNILDSFSDSSATELDTLLQQEQGMADTSSNSDGGAYSQFDTYSNSQNSSSSSSISASLGFGPLSAGGGYGQSNSDSSTTSGGMTNQSNYSANASRASNMNVLNNAINKHVQQSNNSRQIDVNSTTTDSADSGEETTTTREIQNYNKSRVLNITYRQLLQEYYTITYLSNVKFAYSNGYPESYRLVDLAGLQAMLNDILLPPTVVDGVIQRPTPVEQAMCILVSPFFNVPDYEDAVAAFAQLHAITHTSFPPADAPGFFYINSGDAKACSAADDMILRKVKDLSQTYVDNITDFTAKVPGIILNVSKQVLQKPSVIAEALLGTVNALDCFNTHAQDAETTAAYISNLSAMQNIADSLQTTVNNLDVITDQLAVSGVQQTILGAITDPGDQATAYKKVFGSCCPTPQYTGGCGCGNCND